MLRSLLVLALGLLLAGCGSAGSAPVTEASTGEPIRTGMHVVSRGDTLYGVAFRYGWEVSALARRNGLAPPYTIYPGQHIRLDPGAAGSWPSPNTADPAADTGAGEPAPARPSTAATPAPTPAPSTTRPPGEPAEPAAPSHWSWPIADAGGAAMDKRNGLDLPVSRRTQVRAAAAGKVVYAGDGLRSFGNLIILRHGGNYLSAYGHLSRIRVKEGESVKANGILADIHPEGGETGKVLHFEIRHQGRPVDPRTLLN